MGSLTTFHDRIFAVHFWISPNQSRSLLKVEVHHPRAFRLSQPPPNSDTPTPKFTCLFRSQKIIIRYVFTGFCRPGNIHSPTSFWSMTTDKKMRMSGLKMTGRRRSLTLNAWLDGGYSSGQKKGHINLRKSPGTHRPGVPGTPGGTNRGL